MNNITINIGQRGLSVFLIFLEGVKITSVSLKLERPQLQHWLLFLEHNRSENSNVAAGLPTLSGYDYVYDSACDSFCPIGVEWRRLQLL